MPFISTAYSRATAHIHLIERDTEWKGYGECSSSSLFARRQVQSAKSGMQETIWHIPSSDSGKTIMRDSVKAQMKETGRQLGFIELLLLSIDTNIAPFTIRACVSLLLPLAVRQLLPFFFFESQLFERWVQI